MTLYEIVPDATPPDPAVNSVGPEVYYRVVRHPNHYPVPPLPIYAFRVAEGSRRFFFAVPATTPEGPWLEPKGTAFLGSEPPGRNLLTPEGAILAYYADLERERDDTTAQLRQLGDEIARLQAKRSAAEVTQARIATAREAVLETFKRTIPKITDERLAELAERLPLVIPTDDHGMFARVVAPTDLRTDYYHTMVLKAEPDRALYKCGRGTVYSRVDTGLTHEEIYACLDGHGEIPDTAEFVRVHPPPITRRVQPDPANPEGYYARAVTFLRSTP